MGPGAGNRTPALFFLGGEDRGSPCQQGRRLPQRPGIQPRSGGMLMALR